jgi:drug/metabolite transporter (DMT)-like permease
MIPGFGFALGALFCFGLADLVYKRAAAAGIEAGEFVMLQAWTFCPAITLFAFLTGTLHPHASAAWGVLAGVFLLIATYNFAQSLKGGAVSTNAPIFRLNFAITAALAIALLGETLTVAKTAALLCALVAVWLLLAEPGKASGGSNAASLVRVLAATVAMAFVNFFYKVGLISGAEPETVIAVQAWIYTSLATAMRLVRERRLQLTPGAWRYASLAAVALLFAFVLLMHGLAQAPASVLVPVAQMSFVFTAVIGAALFRERLTLRKSAGLAVAIAALALFAAS